MGKASQPENPTANLAWAYSKGADSIFREHSHLRIQLFPAEARTFFSL